MKQFLYITLGALCMLFFVTPAGAYKYPFPPGDVDEIVVDGSNPWNPGTPQNDGDDDYSSDPITGDDEEDPQADDTSGDDTGDDTSGDENTSGDDSSDTGDSGTSNNDSTGSSDGGSSGDTSGSDGSSSGDSGSGGDFDDEDFLPFGSDDNSNNGGGDGDGGDSGSDEGSSGGADTSGEEITEDDPMYTHVEEQELIVFIDTTAIRAIQGSASPPPTYFLFDIESAQDLVAYVKGEVYDDKNILEAEISLHHVSVDYRQPARLFGFIPIAYKQEVTVVLTQDYRLQEINFDKPWWLFFASGDNTDELESQIRSEVNALLAEGEPLSKEKVQGILQKLAALFSRLVKLLKEFGSSIRELV